MKIIRRIAAGILCAALALSLASCKDTTWSYRIDGVEITSGMYIAFQINAYMEASQEVEDTSKDPLTQQIDGKDAEVWIADRVLEMCKSYAAVEKKFSEMGLTLSDEDQNRINTTHSSNWSYMSSYYEPNGAGEQSYKKILTNSYKSNMIFEKYYDKGGLEEVSDEDLKKEFVDKIALVKYVKMPMKDAEGNKLKSEGKAELKKTAEKYLDRLKKGEKIDDLIKEYEEFLEKQEEEAKKDDTSSGTSSTSSATSSAASSAASSAPASSASSSSVSSAASSTSSGTSSTSSGSTDEEEEDPNEVLIYKEDETKPEKFINSVFEAEYNEPVILEDDENYYVTIRYDISKDEKKFEDYRDSLLQELKGDTFDEMVKGWYKDYTVETNEDSAKRYKLKNLKFS